MECVNYKISENIPSEFDETTSASAAFYKLVNILNQLEGEDCVKKHTIVATTLGHLIELQEGRFLRSKKLISKAVTKIVVHHEFHPLQLFIVLLYDNHKAVILSYNDLEILHEWEDVCDVCSTDTETTGVAHLRLSQLSGDVITIPRSKLLNLSDSDDQQSEVQKGKNDAVEALAQRLKVGISHVEQLNVQRRMKETFIAKKLVTLQTQLQGLHVSDENKLMPILTIEDDDDQESKGCRITAPTPQTCPLKVLNVRHKIVHDKWVIGLNIINDSDRLLISNPELILQAADGMSHMSYRSHILKTVQRRQTKPENGKDPSSFDTKVTIEKLEPPILRPSKRACILAVCDIPTFNEGPVVTCSGVISYKCKSLHIETTQLLVKEEEDFTQQYQISFAPIDIVAHELQRHFLTVELSAAKGGVPFSCVALYAGSVCNSLSITSFVSPLTEIIPSIMKIHNLLKVCGVSDLYCFYPTECHPLRHAAFTYHPVNTHSVDLKLYTKNEEQALLLVHSLLAILPNDANIQPPTINVQDNHSRVEKVRHRLLTKMKEAATFVIDGYEAQLKSHKRCKDDDIEVLEEVVGKSGVSGVENQTKVVLRNLRGEPQEVNQVYMGYLNEREDVLARKGDVTFEVKLYNLWREKLNKIQCDMDNLYVKYLE